MYLWDYFSGSNLNKIRVSPSPCDLCFVICLADRPNLLSLKSTEFLPPRGWSYTMTFALPWYHGEWCTSHDAISGEIERNCMWVSHPKCRLDFVVLHICLVLHKKTRKQLHHDFTYFKMFNVNIMCSLQVLTRDPAHGRAQHCRAWHCLFSTTEGPQPCPECPKFTRSNAPTRGFTWYPTRRIYLDRSKWNKWENKKSGKEECSSQDSQPYCRDLWLATQDNLYIMQSWSQNTAERWKFYNINQRCGGCSWSSAR